ncbi:MAG TPA: chorismate mutase [Thermoanaerobaculia bacterium]
MTVFAVRGAIQVDKDSPDSISAAVASLCGGLTRANRLSPSRIISAIFTLTPDLASAFPARAAREQGWNDVPMICAQEIPVPDAPPRIVRVLVFVRGRGEARHVYLNGALDLLRPDLASAKGPRRGSRALRRKRRRP